MKFLLFLLFFLQLVTGQTILLTNVVGGISRVINSPNDSFEWIIRPNVQLDYVMFIFNSIAINTAQLTIYDVNIESPLFTCSACGQLLPPIFTSKTGIVSIKLQGVAGTSFTSSSFILQYVGQVSSGQILKAEYFKFLVNLYMGYGQIIPPLVGGQILPKSSNMTWLINVPAPTITFSLASLRIPSNSQVTVTIYDGSSTSRPVIFAGSSSTQQSDYWISTTSSSALVVLFNPEKDEVMSLQLDYFADMELYRCGSLNIPDNLMSNSMRITDGSKSTNNLRRGAYCEWLIKPLQIGPVNLLFRWVSLKPGARVIVYDSPDTSGIVLWDSFGTFTVVPPPIISSGTSLYVTYTSNTLLASSFLGFQGDYYSGYHLTPGVGTKQEFYSMSSAIGLKLPDRLSSITQPNYKSGFDYSYLIQPQSTTSPIVLFFNYLSFPDCGDKLEVYDGRGVDPGKLLGVFCSATPYRWLYAPSGQMLIRFTANFDSSRNASFDLSYYSDGPNYHCGFTTNPAIITSISRIITDGSHSSEPIYANQQCEWIVSPIGENYGIFLYFERLNINGGGLLKIYDGEEADTNLLISMKSARVVPVPIYTQRSHKVKIVYSSSSTPGIGTGFSLSYFSINSYHTGPGDDVIKIYSSSYASLTLPKNVVTKKSIGTNYTWYINPSDSSDPIYFLFKTASISNCMESIIVYEGSPTVKTSKILTISCSGVNPSYRWGSLVKVQNGEMVVDFISSTISTSLSPTESDFQLAYFSTNGASFQCGIARNPLRLNLFSYFISDGTKIDEKMQIGDSCEWIIEIERNYIVAIEILFIDLRGGGKLWFFDGISDTASILWSCFDCINTPPLLLSTNNELFIRYTSPTVNSMGIGFGFQAIYWSLERDSYISPADSLLLLPRGFSFSTKVPLFINQTDAWNLTLSEDLTTLIHYPSYKSESEYSDLDIEDSRNPFLKELYSSYHRQYTCGVIYNQRSTLKTSTTLLHSSQSMNKYLAYTNDTKITISQINGAWTQGNDADILFPTNACVYLLDSGSIIRSITLNVEQFTANTVGHLRIYGGITGTDRLVVDLFQTRNKKLKILLPCGKGLVIIDSNSTNSSLPVDYGFRISYALNKDFGKACKKYIRSLKGVKKKKNFLQKLLIPLFILVPTMVLVFTCLFIQNKLPKFSYCFPSLSLFWPSTKKKKTKKGRPQPTPNPYPPYTPQIDHVRNMMLFHGECVVCHLNEQQVLTLSCKHKICLEDLRGYIVAALGNVSMFPLKCPLYFNNCPGKILPREAKRVLTKPQYEKFCEFCDRAEFGEGIRCIFCNFYVNYPANVNVAMVECPHCLQRCCIKCKKPWHYGQKCPLEVLDDSLDIWTKQTGAQKCPTCLKVIEKDDPDTCHHMVHKSTDGIPCVRDRTDFCYLCGLEVAPEYPHDEIINPGINHFPDGVFQNCRTILVREREIEREKLRKAKRMKKAQNALRSKSNISMIVPVETDEWEGSIRAIKSAPLLSTDPFDVAWSQTLNGQNNALFNDIEKNENSDEDDDNEE